MSVVSPEVLVEMVLPIISVLALISRTVKARIPLRSANFGPQVTSQNIRSGKSTTTSTSIWLMVARLTVKIDGGF